jgi:hypothetical protein
MRAMAINPKPSAQRTASDVMLAREQGGALIARDEEAAEDHPETTSGPGIVARVLPAYLSCRSAKPGWWKTILRVDQFRSAHQLDSQLLQTFYCLLRKYDLADFGTILSRFAFLLAGVYPN